MSRKAPLFLFWTSPSARLALDAAREFAPDLVHANDWSALPIAGSLKAPFIYDSHEFATGEQEERALWRLVFGPYVAAIEGTFIHRASRVVTVSQGIAERMQSLYHLADTPIVIRNVPAYVDVRPRKVGTPVKVLYQGAYNPDRGLEELIDSVAMWRPGYSLTLRGIGNEQYVAALKARASLSPAADRIKFVEPVTPAELITAANEFDVGVHPIPPRTTQTNYCLPNKFFEYTMAGLCLCVSPAREMAMLVEQHRLGAVMQSTEPAAIAKAINSLSIDAIQAAKSASHEAARTYNWSNESERLLAIYRECR